MIKTTLKFQTHSSHDGRLVIGSLAYNKIKILKTKPGAIYTKVICLFDSYTDLFLVLSELNLHAHNTVLVSKPKQLKEKKWKKYQDFG